MTVRLVAKLQNLLHALARSQRRDGDDDFTDAIARNQLRNILRRSANRHVLNPESLLVMRIIHQNDRLAHTFGVFVADIDGIGTRFARADNHHRHGVASSPDILSLEQTRQIMRLPPMAVIASNAVRISTLRNSSKLKN